MKACFKCGQSKPLDEFYAHPAMADGHLGKCKECTKADVKRQYQNNREKRAEYERRRFKEPQRKAKILIYQRKRRSKHPEKTRAHNMVTRAKKSGKLARQPCEVCGDPKSQAHHDDYSKPLDVRWLCFKHHREIGHGQKVHG